MVPAVLSAASYTGHLLHHHRKHYFHIGDAPSAPLATVDPVAKAERAVTFLSSPTFIYSIICLASAYFFSRGRPAHPKLDLITSGFPFFAPRFWPSLLTAVPFFLYYVVTALLSWFARRELTALAFRYVAILVLAVGWIVAISMFQPFMTKIVLSLQGNCSQDAKENPLVWLIAGGLLQAIVAYVESPHHIDICSVASYAAFKSLFMYSCMLMSCKHLENYERAGAIIATLPCDTIIGETLVYTAYFPAAFWVIFKLLLSAGNYFKSGTMTFSVHYGFSYVVLRDILTLLWISASANVPQAQLDLEDEL